MCFLQLYNTFNLCGFNDMHRRAATHNIMTVCMYILHSVINGMPLTPATDHDSYFALAGVHQY